LHNFGNLELSYFKINGQFSNFVYDSYRQPRHPFDLGKLMILVSACLIGEPVRYDGKSCPNTRLKQLLINKSKLCGIKRK